MTVKIVLRLEGLDLRDALAFERVPEDLEELSFEANGGLSMAVIYTDAPLPGHEAVDWARHIMKLIPGVHVAEALDELVSISDIAARCDVANEAARLWSTGKRRASRRKFPTPRQVVGAGAGGKTMSLYAWREVVSWVREVVHIDPDEGISYLNDAQLADLNSELCQLHGGIPSPGPAWQPMAVQATEMTSRTSGVSSGAIGGLFTRISDALDEGKPASTGTPCVMLR
ncbi:MAG TPA: hypothetical protein VJ851_14100 [Jatrophihabitans sp.]|nr:hypothetical protein [Jatrophihabitans sp.]